MTKAFNNNMKPGVPNVKGFKAPTPGLVAAKPASQGAMPPMKPHTVAGMMNKNKFAK